MKRLHGGGDPTADEYDAEDDPRRLAAQVPRHGQQRHDGSDSEAVNPHDTDWRTTA